MIGGTDIVMSAVGDAAALDACVRIVQRQWPDARFENAETGQKYARYDDIPIGQVEHLLAYRDAESEAMWDADSPDSPLNSMLYLIVSAGYVTAVLDNPNTSEMRALLEALQTMLWTDLLYSSRAA